MTYTKSGIKSCNFFLQLLTVHVTFWQIFVIKTEQQKNLFNARTEVLWWKSVLGQVSFISGHPVLISEIKTIFELLKLKGPISYRQIFSIIRISSAQVYQNDNGTQGGKNEDNWQESVYCSGSPKQGDGKCWDALHSALDVEKANRIWWLLSLLLIINIIMEAVNMVYVSFMSLLKTTLSSHRGLKGYSVCAYSFLELPVH